MKFFFTITIILSFATHSIAQDSCDEQYGKATVIPDEGWCLYAKAQRDKGKPSASAECRCEYSNEDSATNINADDTFDKYNQLNDKYQSLYAKVRNLGYEDVDEKLEILHSIKSYAAGLDALQNSTSYTASVNSDIQALERQKKHQTITLTGKSSKTNTYMVQKKVEAQETLKEIEIEQERERKAQEREALKSKNYYKTSPNTIRTGGYPQNGYNQALQNINSINANYDALQNKINKTINNTFSSSKKSEKNYTTLEDQLDEMLRAEREGKRRKDIVAPIYSLGRLLYEIEKNSDYNNKGTKHLEGLTQGYLFLKVIRLSHYSGPEKISDYTGENQHLTRMSDFKSNDIPRYNVYYTNSIKIPLSSIQKHHYLFSLYYESIKNSSSSDPSFGVQIIAFTQKNMLDETWDKIHGNYNSTSLLDFRLDNSKFRFVSSFEAFVSENLDKEKEYLQKIAINKKRISNNKKNRETIFNESISYKKVEFKHKPYYIVEFKNQTYGLIDESGDFLFNRVEYPIYYLGNGYFEIFGEIITASGGNKVNVPTRKSIMYNLNEKKYYPNALFIQDYKKSHNYLLLFDAEIKKWGFIYMSPLSGREIIVVYPRYGSVESFGLNSDISPNLYVTNNGLYGVVNSKGQEIVPIKYVAIKEHQVTENLAFGSIKTTHYWCRTVEDYKIAHKFDETGKYLGKWKLHKSWNYIKRLD